MDDDSSEFGPSDLRAIREQAGISQRALEDALGFTSHGYLSKVENGRERLTGRLARVYRGLRDGVPLEDLRKEWHESKPRSKPNWTTIPSEEVTIRLTDDGATAYILQRILIRALRETTGQPLFEYNTEQDCEIVAVEGGELAGRPTSSGRINVGLMFPKPLQPGEEHLIQLMSTKKSCPPADAPVVSYFARRLEWYDLQRLTISLWVPPDLSDQFSIYRISGLQPRGRPSSVTAEPLIPTANGFVRVEFRELTPVLAYGLTWRHDA